MAAMGFQTGGYITHPLPPFVVSWDSRQGVTSHIPCLPSWSHEIPDRGLHHTSPASIRGLMGCGKCAYDSVLSCLMKTLLRAAGVNEHSDGVYGGICVPCIYFLACSVRAPVGDSGLCCCVPVTSFERHLTHPRTN